MTAAPREFKPRRPPFIIPRVVTAVVVLSILSSIVVVVALVSGLWLLVGVIPLLWLALGTLSVVSAFIAYKKERYEIHADHLVCHRGTLLSDGRTELDVRNITHVRLKLPWIRHKLFGIGDVRVESAGSAASEITFQSIVGPEEVFQEIQDLMRNNGYSMQQKQTLHEESPGVVGALTHVVQVGIGALVAVLFAVGGFFGLISDVMDGDIGLVIAPLMGLITLGSLVFAAGWLVVRFLDMTRRTYIVYDDAVVYTEGFLTRNNAIIPFENIADAAANRTFVDQVLGLYDVKVSCQGSGSEIVFRRLAHGEELSGAIRTLVGNASARAHEAKVEEIEQVDGADQPSGDARRRAPAAQRERVDPSDAWTADLKMNVLRAQLPLLVLIPAFPLWVVSAISMLIRATNTTYTVGPTSMSSAFSFMGSSQEEFAYDKVTGVQVNRSPLDNLTHTFSVQIWSIGASKPLTLQHVQDDQVDLPALLRQCGIDASAPVEGELKQSFGPLVWAVQNVFALVFLMVASLVVLASTLFLGPLALLVVPLIIVWPLPMALLTWMRVKRQRVTFHKAHVESQTGILLRKHVYARYDNVKKVQSTQIPFTDQGRLKLFVAGERIQQQQNGKQGGVKVPNSLEGAYIQGISTKTDAVDALMLGVIEPAEINGTHAQDDDVVSVSKPAVLNSVVLPAILGLFFPPIWLMVPVVAWQTAVRSYSVETDRVVVRGGILFKYSTSVIFDRIDSLQQNQGAMGKMFSNGVVTILTAGSSAPDLVIANIPDYKEVYATIRKHYGKG